MEHTAKSSKQKIVLILAYVISIGLIGSYFFILYLSLHPKTSDEYRLFYLERRLAYALSDGQLAVETGHTYQLDGKADSEDTFYGVGSEFSWEKDGDDFANTGFCYTTGPEANLYFTGLSGKACRMTIHVADAAADGQDATANGQDATADGQDATANGQDATANGQDAAADGQDATADGQDAAADGQDATDEGRTAATSIGISVDGGQIVTEDVPADGEIRVTIPADRADERGVTRVTLYPGTTGQNNDRGISIDYVRFDE